MDEFDNDGIGPFRGLVNGAPYALLFWLVVAAFIAISCTGCGGGEAPRASEEPAKAEEAIDMTRLLRPDTPTPSVDCKSRPEICR